jgi:hypothetical protein
MTTTVAGIEGVRVTQAPPHSMNGDSPQLGVVIAPASGPQDEDETVFEDGIAVFVERDLAPLLSDKRLDVLPAGQHQIVFVLSEQSEP